MCVHRRALIMECTHEAVVEAGSVDDGSRAKSPAAQGVATPRPATSAADPSTTATAKARREKERIKEVRRRKRQAQAQQRAQEQQSAAVVARELRPNRQQQQQQPTPEQLAVAVEELRWLRRHLEFMESLHDLYVIRPQMQWETYRSLITDAEMAGA